MNTNELKEYLEIIVDMEKSIYMQKRTIEKMKQEIEVLGIRRKITKPELSVDAQMGVFVKIGLVFATFVTLALGIGSGILGIELLSPTDENMIWKIIYVVLGLLFLGGAAKLLEISFEAAQYVCQIKKAKIDYKNAQDEYRAYNKADKMRVREELIHREYIITQLQELEEIHKSTMETLEKFYDKNIIFPKYRNLVMVCSLYEYICAGRCTSLEGSDGAYNILETEIRLDKIIIQIDTAIKELNSLKNGQYMLLSVIQETNRQSDLIFNSLNNVGANIQNINENMSEHNRIQNEQILKMQQNTCIAAYYAEQSQKELQYMNRMNYLSGKNNATFYNFPPS